MKTTKEEFQTKLNNKYPSIPYMTVTQHNGEDFETHFSYDDQIVVANNLTKFDQQLKLKMLRFANLVLDDIQTTFPKMTKQDFMDLLPIFEEEQK